MDKQAYLEESLQQIENILSDNGFRNQLYQVRARAIQEEFATEEHRTKFTFETKQIWRYCNYIFNETARLLLENHGNKGQLIRQIRIIAEAFEFLSKFADKQDEEILLINSALCYHMAGYQANALCIAKLIEGNFLRDLEEPEPNNFDQISVFLFRHTLVNFLQRNISQLRKITTRGITSVHNLQESVTRKLSSGDGTLSDLMDLTAHAYFYESLNSFVNYCLDGDIQDFEKTKIQVQKSSAYFKKSGDIRLGTITSEIVPLIDLFNERSTWSVIQRNNPNHIQNRIWQTYLRNLALNKSVVEFWPAQLKAIEHGLLNNDDSYVIQMPTSAGKTFVAELAILSALTEKDNAKCLYIAPYRALVNEVQTKLADTLGAVGFRISTLIGGFEFDAFQEILLTNTDVVVATPEKSELLIRTHPEFFENLTLVIIDEGHMIDEGILKDKGEEKSAKSLLEEEGTLGRGVLLEFLITRLKTKYVKLRFIFISAVMPQVNADDFVQWLSSRQNPITIEPHQRPSRQVLAKFEWLNFGDSKPNGTLEYISLDPLPDGKRPFVSNFLMVKKYYTGELTPKGKGKQKTLPSPIDNKVQSTALLSIKFARSGPTLVFCTQVSETFDVINNVVTTLKYFQESGEDVHTLNIYNSNPDIESYELAKSWLGDEHILSQGLRYGVGLHVGYLPDSLRQAIEDEFKTGKIQILVSTNTLGQGVNLPIKTVIIHSLERRWYDNSTNPPKANSKRIKSRDFWNIGGRAGRAGKETEGQIIFLNIGSSNKKLSPSYQNPSELEEVESAIFDILEKLIEQRLSGDELIGYLDPYILALLAEEIVDTDDEGGIVSFLNHSLVGIQAQRKKVDISPLVKVVYQRSHLIISRVPDKTHLALFASTGLRLSSCEYLEESVEKFINDAKFQEIISNKADDILSCNELLVLYIYEVCSQSQLIETKIDKRIENYPPDPNGLFQAWVNGLPISEIRAQFWGEANAEDFGKYISDQFSYKLPWVINGFLHILASYLQIAFEELPQPWQQLPSMVKYGVNDIVSCWASSIGVNSRSFSKTISKIYLDRQGILDFQAFVEWAMNLPHEFVIQYMDGSKFEKQRFLEARDRLLINRDLFNHIRNRDQSMFAEVRGFQYENRLELAQLVKKGDKLELESEIDNSHDPYAVRVMFNGEKIGYVQRDKARIISKEIEFGRSLTAEVIKTTLATNVDMWTSTMEILIQITDTQQ